MMIHKEPRLENPNLLLLARNAPRPCLIRSPQCITLSADTSCCACHGNFLLTNKGKGLKSHDFYSVWGCSRCHTWLDASYTAEGYVRELAFWRALERQVEEWAAIARGPSSRPRDVESCRWALSHLVERGRAALHPILHAIPIAHKV